MTSTYDFYFVNTKRRQRRAKREYGNECSTSTTVGHEANERTRKFKSSRRKRFSVRFVFILCLKSNVSHIMIIPVLFKWMQETRSIFTRPNPNFKIEYFRLRNRYRFDWFQMTLQLVLIVQATARTSATHALRVIDDDTFAN